MRALFYAGVTTIALFATPVLGGEKKPVDSDKKICRRDYGNTGSILPKSVCHTAADWKVIDEQNHDDAARRLTNPGGSNPSIK